MHGGRHLRGRLERVPERSLIGQDMPSGKISEQLPIDGLSEIVSMSVIPIAQ